MGALKELLTELEEMFDFVTYLQPVNETEKAFLEGQAYGLLRALTVLRGTTQEQERFAQRERL